MRARVRGIPGRTVALGIAVAGLACGEGVAPSDLAGTWRATVMQYIDQEDETRPPVDVIAQGAAFTITFRADGTLATAFTDGGDTITTSGTYTISGSTIVINDGVAKGGTIKRDGDTLTIELFSGIEYDFTGDGFLEAADLLLVLVPA
jgi:hypothetical protein